MRVGDLVEQTITTPLPDPAEADLYAIRQTFVPTLESLEAISRILEATAQAEQSHRAAVLLLGRRGVGKTHLLRYLLTLLGDPDDPAWHDLEQRLVALRRPREPLRAMLVDVSEEKDESLDSLLHSRFGWNLASLQGDTLPDILALDGISLRLAERAESSRIQEDLEQCARVATAFTQLGRCVLFAAEERHVRVRSSLAGDPPLGSLAEKCSVIWLSSNSVAEMIGSSLARKREGCRAEIVRLHERLRAYLPRMESDEETFFNLYPILPEVFHGLFSLRESFPRFSPAEFVQSAVHRVMDRPAGEMVTLADLYESIIPFLRGSDRGWPLLEAVEEIERTLAADPQSEMHSRSNDVARAVACMTAMGSENVDAIHLANALLLYDSSGALPGYDLGAAVLDNLEKRFPSQLSGEGSGESRRYLLRCRRSLETATAKSSSPLGSSASCEEKPGESGIGSERRPVGDRGDLPWTTLVSGTLVPRPEEFLGRLGSLPIAVRTTKVWETIRPVFSRLEALVQLQLQPKSEGVGPREAEAYYSQLFAGNRRLFDEWNLLRAEIITWLEWLPSFERIHRYVVESFPTGLASVDTARDQLLASLASPHVLMNEGPRAKLEEDFARFRVQYAGYYEALHESTVGIGAGRGKETAVDVAGLRNLDLLSRLPYVDKKWFYRTRVKVQRLQRRRCSLPVRKVLEERPRCLCNFNPSGDRTLVEAVADLNELIRDGNESLRAFLRRGAAVIIQEVGSSPHEDTAAQSIAALLSSGTMLPLTQEVIEKLRAIMLRHPAPFHAGH